MKSNGLIYVMTGVLLLCLCVSGVSADLCTSHPTVCNTRTGNIFGSIQAAIDDATTLAGDTIAVDGPSGSSYAPFTVSKQLTIQGRDSGNGLPQVFQYATNPAISIGSGVSGVTLDSFILYQYPPSGTGVNIPAGSSNNKLYNLHVTGFQTGISLGGSGSNNNLISQGTLDGGPQGLILQGSQNTVQDSTFSNIQEVGISLGNDASDTDNIIHGNTFTNILPNSYYQTPAAIRLFSPSNTIDSNIFTNNYVAIVTYPTSPQGYGTNNLIYNNNFQDSGVNNIGDTTNVWNTAKTPGTNIIGGSYLGGNYWASPAEHQDFSLTCTNEGDGICNAPFTNSVWGIVDNYPLTSNVAAPGPTVTSISPNWGVNTNPALNVEIGGTNFVPQYLQLSVQQSGGGSSIPISNVNVVNSNTITCTLDLRGIAPSSSYDVYYSNPDGQSGTLNSGFRVTVPGQTVPFDVFTTPEGANIILDSGDTGFITPHTFNNLVYGSSHTVVVELQGYWSQSATIIMEGDGKSVYFTPESAGDFSAAPVSPQNPLTVQFTEAITPFEPTSRTWSFGDGATSTQQNPVHTYTSAGTYNVNLIVYNILGEKAEIKKEITVTVLAPGTVIEQGATVFIGEGGLDVTHALNEAQGLPPDGTPSLTRIGW